LKSGDRFSKTAYEVLAGNTSDKTTLADFLQAIETQYGQADRVWVMDRGIPTEETLAAMRRNDRPIYYLVGTPHGKLSQLEQAFLTQPWQQIRDEVQVRLLPRGEELFVLARRKGKNKQKHGPGSLPGFFPAIIFRSIRLAFPIPVKRFVR
jgi:hypothetical protein